MGTDFFICGNLCASVAQKSKLILALGVKELEGAIVVVFRHEDSRGAVQVAVVGQRGVHEILRGGDAMFVEHRDEHLGVDDRAGVKQFHAGNLAADARG